MIAILLMYSADQVLTSERGVLYPLDFILDKGFRWKKNSPKHQAVRVEVQDKSKLLKKGATFCEIDSEPAIESISLEMKQQELDRRYRTVDIGLPVFLVF